MNLYHTGLLDSSVCVSSLCLAFMCPTELGLCVLLTGTNCACRNIDLLFIFIFIV